MSTNPRDADSEDFSLRVSNWIVLISVWYVYEHVIIVIHDLIRISMLDKVVIVDAIGTSLVQICTTQLGNAHALCCVYLV